MAEDEPPKRLRPRLVLDELTDQLTSTFKLIQDPESVAERVLADAGVHSQEEARIVGQLANLAVLAHPDRFSDAHQLTMRALEVLDREGWRNPQLKRVGFLRPLALYVVELIARYIVRSYARDVVVALRKLYTRREAQAPPRTPERLVLSRARLEATRVGADFKPGSLVPTFLIGGAAVPAAASALKKLNALPTNIWVVAGGAVVLFVLFGALAWLLLQGAAVAHRRAELIIARPLTALYETIGLCGNPPRDDSLTFAIVAIALTAVAWLAIPAAIALAFTL